MILTIITSASALATDFSCSSVEGNALSINVSLKTTLYFNEVRSGTYSYQYIKENEPISVKGKFLCGEADEKRNQLCGTIGVADPNIKLVGFSGLVGLGMTILDQRHAVLFDCIKD